jgi:CRP-like cAMP-binding protein
VGIPDTMVSAYAQLIEQAVGAQAAAVLLPHMDYLQLTPGDVLLTYGVPSSDLFVLCAGELHAHLPLDDGEQLVLGTVAAGKWLGELNIIDQGPSSATVVASAACILFRLSHASLAQVERERPDVASKLLARLTRDLAERMRRSTSGVVERVGGRDYRLAPPPQQQGWLARLLGGLMGTQA